VKRKGPEYETLVGFGANLLFDNPVVITKLGNYVIGMDGYNQPQQYDWISFKFIRQGKDNVSRYEWRHLILG
jgi:hypothetical protein